MPVVKHARLLSAAGLVTVTDPFGNTTSLQSSKFVNPANGETAVGPGGGTVDGPEGTSLLIPEGALVKGIAMKLEALTLTPEQSEAEPVGTCDASELRVKTASPPYPELLGNFLADTYIILTFEWAGAEADSRTALAGVVAGRCDDRCGELNSSPAQFGMSRW